MNGSLPIFPDNVKGQQASLLARPAPGDRDNGFAESLNAALSASSLIDAVPFRRQPAAPASTSSGDLLSGLRPSETASASEVMIDGSAPGVGITLVRQRHRIDPGGQPSGSKAASAEIGPGRGMVSADLPTAADAQTARADVHAAPLAGQFVHVGPSLMADMGASAHLEPQPAGGLPAEARSGQTIDGAALDLLAARTDADRPELVSKSLWQRQMPMIGNDALEPVQGSAVTAASSALALETSLQTDGPLDVLSAGVPPANPTLRPALQAAHSRASSSADISGTLVEPLPSSAAPFASDVKALGASVLSASASPLQHSIETPGEPFEVQLPTERPLGAVSRPENASPAPGRSVGRPDGEPIVSPSTTSFLAPDVRDTLNSGRSPAGSASASPLDKSSASLLAAGGKSGPVTNPTSGALQGPGVEAGAGRIAEFGFDRFQPMMSADARAQEIARADLPSGFGAARSPALTTSSSAGDQVALQIVRSLPKGADRLSVHLQPAELGRVDIQLDFDGPGRMSVMIIAERPETLELLQRDSRLLERSLGDSGLKLTGDGLSFALKQDQQQGQQGQNFHDQAQARQTAFRAGRAYDEASDAEPATPSVRIDGLRLLDIRT